MNKIGLLITIIFFTTHYHANSQDTTKNSNNYDLLIREALIHQMKADSLWNEANKKRKTLVTDIHLNYKNQLETEILDDESKAFQYQQKANNKYIKARKIEEEWLTKYGNFSTEVYRSEDIVQKSFENRDEEIMMGMALQKINNIKPYNYKLIEKHNQLFSMAEISEMETLNTNEGQADQLIQESYDIQEKIEDLTHQLNSEIKSRRKKKLSTQIDELKKISQQKRMEAVKIYQEVNTRKYDIYKNAIQKAPKKNENLSQRFLQFAQLNYDNAQKLKDEGQLVPSKEKMLEKYLEGNTYEILALENLTLALDTYYNLGLVQDKSSIIEIENYATADNSMKQPNPPSNKAESIVKEYFKNQTQEKIHIEKPENTSYEKFRIMSTPPYSETQPIPEILDISDGLIIRIQAGAFASTVSHDYFKGLYPVSMESLPSKGMYRYYIGFFKSLNEADIALQKVREYGFTDAFLVATMHGKRISTAYIPGRNNPEKTQVPVIQPVTTPSGHPEKIIVDSLQPVFKVQIGAYSKGIPKEVVTVTQTIAPDKIIENHPKKNGITTYTIGIFSTFEEAVSMKKSLIENGVPDAFVVAFLGNNQISIDEALKLTN